MWNKFQPLILSFEDMEIDDSSNFTFEDIKSNSSNLTFKVQDKESNRANLTFKNIKSDRPDRNAHHGFWVVEELDGFSVESKVIGVLARLKQDAD